MKERPILFSGPMIRALLAGTKTQTRRVVRDQSAISDIAGGGVEPVVWWPRSGDELLPCPYGVLGDRLWVRETWRTTSVSDRHGISRAIEFQADGAVEKRDRDLILSVPSRVGGAWKPSIFMSRWASRLTLEITDVRVQRLQEISEEDATAEGCPATEVRWWQGFMRDRDGNRGMVEGGASPDGPPPPDMESPELQTHRTSARDNFASLWNGINGKRAPWASNPWVWALTFRKVTA